MTPVLAAGLSAGVDQHDGQAGAGRGRRRRETRRPGADHDQLSCQRPRSSVTPTARHVHAVDRRHQAGALVRRAVDGQQAVVADADAAEESARTPLAAGGPPRTHAGPGQRRTHAVADDRGNGSPVEDERDRRPARSATGCLELVAREPLGSEGRQVQVGGRADERLREELGGAHRQADPGTLVPAGVPQARSPAILADDREMVRAVRPEPEVAADRPWRSATWGTTPPPAGRAGSARAATRCGRSRPAPGTSRSARCRWGCSRRRVRSADPRRSSARWRRTRRA